EWRRRRSNFKGARLVGAVTCILGAAALDPDDQAHHLTFTVSQARHGFVTLTSDPSRPVQTFTQADLERGDVMFRHDGTDAMTASFDVVVADQAGATSGAAQTVTVSVR
ncbi:MAG TPA: hypothetical protein EYP98_03535, partial [Planctomycetes bacterium]|nr:hypothetical protein [Planctomycetota bacterium]